MATLQHTDELYHILEDEICALKILPGEALSENQLCKRFGVSRTPIRSVLQRLEQNRFVQIIPCKGTIVTTIDPGVVDQIIFQRVAVETMVFRDFAQSCSPMEIIEVEHLYDLLQQARMDDDSEVVHYASTALAQISKEADLKLQQQEQRYAAAPGDAKVLEEYCDYLESYLDGGFVQGKAAEIQRHQLEQLLKKRLDALGRRSYTLECKLAAAQLALAEYDRAEATLDALTARWPQRETPWLLHLRMAAALRDGAAIQKTLHDIEEKEVYLSAKGRETVRFWQGKNA